MNNLENIEEVLKRAADLSVEEIDAVIIGLVLRRSKSNGAKQELPKDNGDELDTLTVKQVSQKLHTSAWFVYEIMRRGQLPFSTAGRKKLISPRDLREYLKRSRKSLVDPNIYLRYNTSHERLRTEKNTKAVEPVAGSFCKPNRRQGQHCGAMGAGSPAHHEAD